MPAALMRSVRRHEAMTWRIVMSLIVLAAVGLYGDWWFAGRRVNRTIEGVAAAFPDGVSFDAARRTLTEHYPRSTVYAAAECEHRAHQGVPAPPQALGGPCIFGIKEAGETMWGFRSDVSFDLMFDTNDVLRTRRVHPIYTWL